MQPSSTQSLTDRYQAMTTEALLDQLKTAGADQAGDADKQAIGQILQTRQLRFPDPDARVVPAGKREQRELGANSNASLAGFASGKVELHFPSDGFLKSERSKFESREDLVSYLADVLGLPDRRNSARLSLKRKGKYQRLARSGRPIFTFGDPILDLVTDEHGWVTIGAETYHPLAAELGAPQSRSGGVSTLDLQVNHEEIRRQQILEAVSLNGSRALVEHTAERTVIASTNPSVLDFWSGSAHMRFRSWKKNYVFYRSIGTEIETWGGNFNSASIQSQYADPVVPSNPFICGITKRDSDSDTNDDYVDEYEVGVFANPAATVRSYCEARWKGQTHAGTVWKGDCQVLL